MPYEVNELKADEKVRICELAKEFWMSEKGRETLRKSRLRNVERREG